MTRILVHAGFHKTGTTSLQSYLIAHRRALAPTCAIYTKADFEAASYAGRRYAQRRFPWRLAAFRRALEQFLADIPDAETIVLTRETFSGAMPGHRNWLGRPILRISDAAIPLCREIAAALQRRFGAEARVEFLFTTRATEPWLRSVYGHLLRSIHLAEEYDAFRARLGPEAGPEAELARIARALHPLTVHGAALEDLSARHEGPAAAVLDLVGLSDAQRAKLPAAPQRNIGNSPDLQAAFLDLNRSGLAPAELRARKEALLRGQAL